MSVCHEMQFRVDSRDVDLFNQCRPSAVLGMLQESATQAALELGLSGPEVYEKYGCMWMVTRNWVELEVPLRWNDRVVIRTWHRGASGASSYRDFDLFRDGARIGQGVALWVLVEADSHRLYRMRDVGEFAGTDGGEACKNIRLRRLAMPPAFEGRHRRDMGYSDTDINGHVNNIHYADFACDALHLERLCQGKFVRSFQIGYLSECRAGETLWVDTAAQGGGLYARGMGEDRVERFDCAVTLAPLPPGQT